MIFYSILFYSTLVIHCTTIVKNDHSFFMQNYISMTKYATCWHQTKYEMCQHQTKYATCLHHTKYVYISEHGLIKNKDGNAFLKHLFAPLERKTQDQDVVCNLPATCSQIYGSLTGELKPA